MARTLETVIGWLSIQEAIDLWPQAPEDQEEHFPILANLMATAHEFLEFYALPVDPAPERYKKAQVLYMQHLHNRARTGDGDAAMGADGLAVSTYPLVMEARSLVSMGRSPIRGIR